MKNQNRYWVLSLSFLWISSLALGEIREIQSMDKIIPEVTSQTLLIFDLDNTLIEPLQTLGSDQWFGDFEHRLQKNGLSKTEATDRAIPLWKAVQLQSEVKPVEQLTPALIQEFQNQNIKIMGLTARPIELAERTLLQLASIGIQLARTAPVKKDFQFENLPGTQFINGIVFLGPKLEKGPVLVEFLRQAQLQPQKTVFVDDRPRHTQTVDAALKAAFGDMAHIEFRYGNADLRVREFNRDLADCQYAYFKPKNLLFPDDFVLEWMKKAGGLCPIPILF